MAAPDLDRPLILVAKPGLSDEVYGAAVLVVRPLGGGQHVGFIVNRPSELTLGKIFPEHMPSRKVADPVYVGGPVQPQLMFALVQGASSPGGRSLEVMPGLYAVYESAVFDRIIETDAQRARFLAGLVAWQAGELQAEIDLGAWIVLEADAELVMHNADGLWDDLVRRWRQRWNSI